MKKKLVLLIVTNLLFWVLCSYVIADIGKGQKVYAKFLKKTTGINGAIFSIQHTEDEWRELFENNADKFRKECISKFPKTEKFISGGRFDKLKEHLQDFLMHYASDSGNIPKC